MPESAMWRMNLHRTILIFVINRLIFVINEDNNKATLPYAFAPAFLTLVFQTVLMCKLLKKLSHSLA